MPSAKVVPIPVLPDIPPVAIKIYPNPFSGKIHINLTDNPKAELQILNSTGKIIFKTEISGDKPELDLSWVPTGFYVFKIVYADCFFSKIIVKQ